jgi:hypothetical protein
MTGKRKRSTAAPASVIRRLPCLAARRICRAPAAWHTAPGLGRPKPESSKDDLAGSGANAQHEDVRAWNTPCCLQASSTLFQIANTASPWIPRCRSPNCPLRVRCIKLDASDRGRSIAELLEAEHYGDALLDGSVVLLNEVVEVFRRAQLRVGRQKTICFQLAHSAVRRSVAV